MLVVSGCYRNEDRYHERAAELVCDYNAKTPNNPIVDRTAALDPPVDLDGDGDAEEYAPYGGEFCQDDVIENLQTCSAECSYDNTMARRCVRRLRKAVRSGEFGAGVYDACNSVYACEEVSTMQRCNLTTDECSVVPDRPPSLALLSLFVLGLVRRRSQT